MWFLPSDLRITKGVAGVQVTVLPMVPMVPLVPIDTMVPMGVYQRGARQRGDQPPSYRGSYGSYGSYR